MRLRWRQIYTEPDMAGDWAIDNVVIGNRTLHCPQLCSGRGRCTVRSVCVCDEGFSGRNCEDVDTEFPNYIQVKSCIIFIDCYQQHH